MTFAPAAGETSGAGQGRLDRAGELIYLRNVRGVVGANRELRSAKRDLTVHSSTLVTGGFDCGALHPGTATLLAGRVCYSRQSSAGEVRS